MTTKHFTFQTEVRAPFLGKDKSLQTNKTRLGKAIETALVAVLELELSDIIETIEREVYVPDLTELNQIDIVVTLKNGHKIYLAVSNDVWIGTFQTERLSLFYSNATNRRLLGKDFYDYAIFCAEDVLTYLEETEEVKLSKWLARKEEAGNKNFSGRRYLYVYNMVLELYLTNRLHNLDSLIDYIRKCHR